MKKELKQKLFDYLKLKKGETTKNESKINKQPIHLLKKNTLQIILPIATVVIGASDELNAQTVKHGTVDKTMNFTQSHQVNKTVTLSGITLTFKGNSYGRIDVLHPNNTSHVPNPTNGALAARLAYGYSISTANAIKDNDQDVIQSSNGIDKWNGEYFGFEKGGRVGWAKISTTTNNTFGGSVTLTIDAWAHTDANAIEAGKTTLGSAVPTVNISAVTASSATIEDSGTPLRYTFTLSAAAASTITVKFEISGGTAGSGDFTVQTGGTFNVTFGNTIANQGTIDIPMGGTTAELEIIPITDAIIEENETVAVKVLAP